MGLNIQSDEFWDMRPDMFYRMSKAHTLREEADKLPMQKLLFLVAKVGGMEGIERPSQLLSLPLHDALAEKAEAIRNKPIILTAEEKKAKEERYKRIMDNNKLNK